MLKTYDVTCPSCGEDFEVEMDPLTEEDCIECPESDCLEEFDWEYDAATDTVTLLPNEDDDLEADDLELTAEEGEEEEDELS